MVTKKSIWVLLGFFIISAWILGLVIEARAETMKCRVTSYIVSVESLEVGAAEGHFLLLYSRRGLAFFENGEVATITSWVTQDSVKGTSTFQLYMLFTFGDGSTVVAKGNGTTQPDPKILATFKGEGEYAKGTGRFEGIKGTLSWNGWHITPYSKEKRTQLIYILISLAHTPYLQSNFLI